MLQVAWPGLGVLAAVVMVLAVTVEGVNVEENGYRNVIVAVSQDVSEGESGETIINDIKEAMKVLSQAMVRATRRKLYLAEVTILLPYTWRGSRQYQEATTERYLESQVRVLPPNPVYGDQPFTVQPGGCGDPGLYLHLTPRYLKEEQVACRWGDKGKALMREWAKLRWGVFEEQGYKADAVFPSYYWHAERPLDTPRLVPNDCTDEPVLGKFVKSSTTTTTTEECTRISEEDEECHFEPQYLQNASSSILGNYHLSSVHSFCDSDERTHNMLAPNRHNLKCGEPAWDVITRHSDLGGNSTIANGFSILPRFTVVREVAAKYVVALETTEVMVRPPQSQSRLLKQLMDGLRQWMRENVADESYVGLLEYGIVQNVKLPLTRAGEGSRDSLLAALNSQQELPGSPCYVCALRYAMQMLGDRRNNSAILLVASGEEPYLHAQSEDIVAEMKENKIRLLSLVLREDGPGSDKLREVANKTEGRLIHLKSDSAVKEYLDEALRSQPRTPSAVRVLLQQSRFSGTTRLLNQTFALDTGLDKDLNLTLTTDYARHITSAPYLLSPSGQRISTQLSRTVSNQYSVRVATPETGRWFWEVRLSGNARYSVDVTISARTTDSVPIQVEAWTNAREGTWNASEHHLIVYARVRRNEAPVTNATVKAFVSGPQMPLPEVRLLDVGAASDVVAGDGIYSRYITDLTDVFGTGLYNIKVEVYGDNSTSYKKDSFQHPSLQDSRYPTSAGCPDPSSEDPPTLCCGSVVPSNPEHEEGTGPFNRTIFLAPIKVTGVRRSTDALPPSRVEDLRVVRAYPRRLHLAWTVPGGDLDKGNVTSYEFLLTRSHSDMPRTPEAAGNPLLHVTYPRDNSANSTTLLRLTFGHTTNLTLDLPATLPEKRLYFLALRSHKAGKNSVPSNVVRLVPTEKATERENLTEGVSEPDVEGSGQGGRHSLQLLSLSEAGMSWEDLLYVAVLVFFMLSCMC